MGLIDRYILKQFLQTLLFALFALNVIIIVVNLIENLGNLLDNNTPVAVIARFYLYQLPTFIKLVMPIAVLLSSLFTAGRMSSLNEITAIKAGGRSMFRLIVPLLIVSFALSIGQLYFNAYTVPFSVREKLSIEREYLKKRRANSSLYNLYLRDKPLQNVLIRMYNSDQKSGNDIALEEYSSQESPRLVRRIDARQFLWDSTTKSWQLKGVMEYQYKGDEIQVREFDSMEASMNTTPKELLRLQQSIAELTLPERKELLEVSKRGGKDIGKDVIAYYAEYALPFANAIIVLFGVPFSSGKRKSGLAVEIGAAMIISFVYLVLMTLGQSIGYALDFPPIMSAWLANGAFLCAGLVNLFRMKS